MKSLFLGSSRSRAMSNRCVKRSKDKPNPSGHKMHNRILSYAQANRCARFSIKHQALATISFLLARPGLEQAGTIGGLKEHTKSSKRYSRQCWWRSVKENS